MTFKSDDRTKFQISNGTKDGLVNACEDKICDSTCSAPSTWRK